jgi:hypothetical protein
MKENYLFDKEWFNKHQRQLLWLSNNFLGRMFFSFKKMGMDIERIDKITPNSVIQIIKKTKRKIYVKEQFFNRNEFSLKLFYRLYPIWFVFHCWDMMVNLLRVPALNFGFDTLTVYPDAGVGNTTVDGSAYHYLNNQAFSTKRAAAGNGTRTTDTNQQLTSLYASATSSSGNCTNIDRGIMTFDTSSISSGATILSATISFYCTSVPNSWNGDTNNNIIIVSSNPAANNNIANSDYAIANFGGTSFNTTSIPSFGTSGYTDLALNASGIANISKIGISKFGMLTGWDFTATGPATWGSGERTGGINIYLSDNGTNKPKLVVNYSIAIRKLRGHGITR